MKSHYDSSIIDELYRLIGQRDIELSWLKKNCISLIAKQKRNLIEKNNAEIKISRQAELIGLPRSSVYYQPQINQEKLKKEKRLMDLIDKIYTNLF